MMAVMRPFALLTLLAVPLPAADLAAAGRELAAAATAFLATLDAGQAKLARFPFTDAERENWHYVPKVRGGVPLKQLGEAQRKAALGLLGAGLGEAGRTKAEAIIALEAILAGIENNPGRDSGLYYFAVFGEPGGEAPWGWRVEGHHLSVNFTLAGGRIAATPSFMGANPAEVREGPQRGHRPLAREEDLARALAASLAEAGKPVVFTTTAPREILTAAARSVQQLEPVGVPASAMTPAQRDALMELLAEYAGRHRKEVAAKDLAKIREHGIEAILFGWAGSLKPGEAYYYRIQGPGFLVEAANTQNNANHIHTVWREFKGDFGRDFLGEHYHDHE